ncbi:hypothetical protein K439DRAFT_1353152 [Ramaria rubella]|nr:hypothetical protein K439DRAFT_1353152 [Ramaria rubella]
MVLLQAGFQSHYVGVAHHKVILNESGACFSIMNKLPGWLSSMKSALDFIPCIFLRLVAFFWTESIFHTCMFFSAVESPSHIGWLPKNLGENQSLKKADEWWQLMSIAPVILCDTWRDDSDSIPDSIPPMPPNTKHVISHSRNTLGLYQAAIFLCYSQEFLVQHCCHLLSLGVELHINHHSSMNFFAQIKLFEPVYASWLFAFKHSNGMLECIKHNGYDRGEMEVTLIYN